MDAETEKFIVASFAAWAGDFEYFEKLLRAFSPPHKIDSKIPQELQDPIDIIRWSGAKRLRQLRQKKGEFKNIISEYKKLGFNLSDKPLIIETINLKSTLWRTGERDFLLQGYLKNLNWQNELFLRARRQSSMVEHSEPDSKKTPVFKPLGVSWYVPGDLFLQAELTDLGFVEATGLWTKPNFPESAEAITVPFSKLLSDLDGSIDNTRR